MNQQPITIYVIGTPQPGGSKKAFALRRRDGSLVTRANGSPIINVTDDAKHNREWKRAVAETASEQYQGPPLLGPLCATVRFVMPRLKGHFGTGRNEGVLKANAPRFHTVAPDAAKLWRSTCDALTGVLYRDDAQIAREIVEKVYGDRPGALITIAPLVSEPAETAELFEVQA
jgi:Holliday junction resolvase RusA-like endonuclease